MSDPRDDPRVHHIPGELGGYIGPPDIMREVIRVLKAEHEAALRQSAQRSRQAAEAPDDLVPDINDYDDL